MPTSTLIDETVEQIVTLRNLDNTTVLGGFKNHYVGFIVTPINQNGYRNKKLTAINNTINKCPALVQTQMFVIKSKGKVSRSFGSRQELLWCVLWHPEGDDPTVSPQSVEVHED